jgi:histidinol-phosphate aminotransferase
MSCDYGALAAEGIRSLHPYQPGKPVEELQRELGLREVVKLASNENPLGPSPKASAAIGTCLASLARYPDGNGFALKAALAEYLQVAPETITLGNGSNDVLDLIARVFLTPAQEAIFSQYAFALYPILTQIQGAKAVVIPALRWGNDLAAMARAITANTRLVWIANPNNPTGTWVTEEDLETFLQSVPQEVLVVVDEAYHEYARRPGYPDCVPWVSRYPNLIVTRTFSKAYGLAGLRVGYAVSQPVLAELLNRVRQPFNVSLAAQVAGIAALEDTAHLADSIAVNRTGLQQLSEALTEMGLEVIPSAGNFLCVETGPEAGRLYQELLRRGIIVRPLANYGMPDFLRVTVGLGAENGRFLAALQQVLAQRRE